MTFAETMGGHVSNVMWSLDGLRLRVRVPLAA